MGIKIKNKDPKIYDFNKDDIVINHKDGTLFFKSDKGLIKLPSSTTVVNSGGSSISASYATTASYAHTSLTTEEATAALTAISASYARTASYAHTSDTSLRSDAAIQLSTARLIGGTFFNGTQDIEIISSSYAISASYAVSSSHEILVETQSTFAELAELATTASYALTASFVDLQTAIDLPANAEALFISASYAISSSYATTASYAETAQTASYIATASFAVSSSNALTASYFDTSTTTFKQTGQRDGDSEITGSLTLSGSGHITASGNISASGNITASNIQVDEYISHNEAGSNTFIKFDPDMITHTVGVETFRLTPSKTILTNVISASRSSGSNNAGDFHHLGGNVRIGTSGIQGQFLGSESSSGAPVYTSDRKGASLEVMGDITVSGSIIPQVGFTHDLGAPVQPWSSLHLFNNSIHFYDLNQSESLENINPKKLGRLSFEESRGLKVRDSDGNITIISGSIVYADEGMKAPRFDGVTGSFQRIENINTASMGRIENTTINGGSF
jgi:hypothetical protein